MNVTAISSTTTTPPGVGDVAQSAVSDATASFYVGQAGITFDPTRVTLSSTGPTAEERASVDYRVALNHRQTPMLQADSSMRVIEEQLGKVQKSIARERPDLARAPWDFSVEDGKLKVSGALSKDDKNWLESKLNGNAMLVSATDSYMSAVTSYLQTSADNPAYSGSNSYTGNIQSFNFSDVQKQLESRLSFKELISTTRETFKSPRTGAYEESGNMFGFMSIEVLASRLTASPLT